MMKESDDSQYSGLIKLLTYLGFLAIPLTLIFQYHYLPFDDGLRHAAKAVSGKSWSEILVLREGFTIDQHPGWHALLSSLHSLLDADPAFLVVFSYLSLFTLFTLSAVPLMKRPEVWTASLLMAALAFPYSFVFRLTRGRPYILSMAFLVILLLLWRKETRRNMGLWIITTVLIAIASFVHGSWYLWIIPGIAFLLAGAPRRALEWTGCWLAGSCIGALLTGHPVAYLVQQVQHATLSFGHGTLSRMLVGEFQPFDGGILYLTLLGLLALLRHVFPPSVEPDGPQAGHTKNYQRFLLILGLLGWLGGLRVFRFWSDWGLPALLVWSALVLEDLPILRGHSKQRFCIASLLALTFYLYATSDLEGRWSSTQPLTHKTGPTNVSAPPLTSDNHDLDGWLPEAGGIVYNSSMSVFNLMFYENPTAPWRYAYGFEAGLMTPENLSVLRNIQYNYGAWKAYDPWIQAMTARDRLILASPTRPELPLLEWKEARPNFWIGKKPRFK
jgi:hypothetical protein